MSLVHVKCNNCGAKMKINYPQSLYCSLMCAMKATEDSSIKYKYINMIKNK